MQITNHEDIRINALIQYLLKQEGISFDLTVSGKRRPYYSFDIYFKDSNILIPEKVCRIGTFKGSFGFLFEYIHINKYSIVYKLFNLSYTQNLDIINHFFDFINKSNNFRQLFDKVAYRDLDDLYHKEFTELSQFASLSPLNEKFVFIDPSVMPTRKSNYPALNFKGNINTLIHPSLYFNFIHFFEINSDGIIYPYPSIEILVFSNSYLFPVDLINKKIYFEKKNPNRDNMYKELINLSNNNKFKLLSDESIDYVLFQIINNFLEFIPYSTPEKDIADIIHKIPLSNINNKINLFCMNYLI